MRKIAILLFLLFTMPKAENEYEPVPFLDVFDGIFLNSGKTFIYNYGLNSAFMVAGTYFIVQTDVDWEWRQFAYNNKPVVYAGMPAVMSGALVPVILPLSLYGIGRSQEDFKLQTAGIAAAQSVIISTTLTTGIKAFTSRQEPHIWGDDRQYREEDFSRDFKFGFLERIPFDGWPSGHTSAAWAMAATLTEFYPDNIPLAVGLYGYAIYMGLGVSTTIHWLSDGWAGAFFGYAIGKTVAGHFTQKESKYSFIVLPDRFMIARSF
ncbi:MAG: phosphatase PAP2 family protein [Fibromonadales bacterium]|nr:phosphatase PAP2 family protein [Fibromonadales bacterium]